MPSEQCLRQQRKATTTGAGSLNLFTMKVVWLKIVMKYSQLFGVANYSSKWSNYYTHFFLKCS